MQATGPKGTLGSKPHSTTRSFDTRSTSCDREDSAFEHCFAKSPKKSLAFDTRAPHFFTSLGKGARKRSRVEEEDAAGIEPVMEEEENDVGVFSSRQIASEVAMFKTRNLVELVEDRAESRKTGRKLNFPGFIDRKGRARSTDVSSLPKVTESKEENFNELQQKVIFGRKLKTLVDLSEKGPEDSNRYMIKRNSSVAPDCLTIEEVEAEDVQIEAIDLLSNDNDSSSRFSTPRSKSISKKHILVDECSQDGEDKKKRYECDFEAIIEERANEEEDGGKEELKGEATKKRMETRNSLAKIVRAEMVTPQDNEILKLLDSKEPIAPPPADFCRTEEIIEDPSELEGPQAD